MEATIKEKKDPAIVVEYRPSGKSRWVKPAYAGLFLSQERRFKVKINAVVSQSNDIFFWSINHLQSRLTKSIFFVRFVFSFDESKPIQEVEDVLEKPGQIAV